MYPNNLKARLRSGEIILGTSLPAPTPHVAGSVISTGPDFLWADTEHMPHATEALDSILVLARMRGVAPMVRVAWNDPALIKKAYDAGAVAVMVPQVDTAAEAAAAVEAARYAPEGRRGLSPMWTQIVGADWNEVIKTANEETLVVLQLESQRAYDNLDEIRRVPGIDVIFVGPLDLSATVGTITDTESRQVQEIMRDVPQQLADTGIAVGTTLGELDQIQEKIRWGYRFLNVGNALRYGVQVLDDHLATLRANPRGDK